MKKLFVLILIPFLTAAVVINNHGIKLGYSNGNVYLYGATTTDSVVVGSGTAGNGLPSNTIAIFGSDGTLTLPAYSNGLTAFDSNGKLVSGGSTDFDGYPTIGYTKNIIKSFYTNAVYAAGLATYDAVTSSYIVEKGKQPVPDALIAGQVINLRFDITNPGPVNVKVATLAATVLKLAAPDGTILNLKGGEITPGPATIYYDGTQFIYNATVSLAKPVNTTITTTISDFANKSTFYGTATGGLTLPCSANITPNGQIFVFSSSGTLTLTKGSGCSDTITRNGSTSTSITIVQGSSPVIITTDGNGNFYASGS